jgi:hypothetical protein
MRPEGAKGGSGMTAEANSLRITLWQLFGIGKQPNKGMSIRRTVLEYFTTMDREFHKTTPKPTFGIALHLQNSPISRKTVTMPLPT